MPFGVTVLAWVGELATLLSVVALALVTAAKGRGWILLLGFIATPIVWIYAALRLAAPSSVWARRWYDSEKLARVRSRYRTNDAGRRSTVLVWVTAVLFAGASVYAAVLALTLGTTITGSLIVVLVTIGIAAPIIGVAILMRPKADSPQRG